MTNDRTDEEPMKPTIYIPSQLTKLLIPDLRTWTLCRAA
jgi:hypothetical protein